VTIEGAQPEPEWLREADGVLRAVGRPVPGAFHLESVGAEPNSKPGAA
jgi:hypothetical protein